MKKTILAIMFVFLWTVSTAVAAPLQIGAKAPDFNLKDPFGKAYSLNAPEWKGKVLLLIDLPATQYKKIVPITDAIKNDKGIDYTKFAKGGIVQSPNFVVRTQLKKFQEKAGYPVLVDKEDIVVGLWGLQPGVPNVIVLDKDMVCRFINKGAVPDSEIAKLVQLIKTYQAK